jgi:hypothetical protein
MDVNPVAVIVIVVIVAILIRVVAGMMDGGRIEDHFSEDGKEFISKVWTPLGKGWLGDSSDRIYKVTYKDKEGHIHEAYCKTSMFSGVYITEDKIIEYNKEAMTNMMNLEAENLKLKEEIERLKKEGQKGSLGI